MNEERILKVLNMKIRGNHPKGTSASKQVRKYLTH
jgi:hypothetical protein